jgi:serpin B
MADGRIGVSASLHPCGYLRLNDTLAALGMPVAFSGEAGFSVMSPLSVQSAVQRDYLGVSEHGTVAYAVTGISLAQSDLIRPRSPTLRFDHPFLFLIRDQATGAILFASLVSSRTWQRDTALGG